MQPRGFTFEERQINGNYKTKAGWLFTARVFARIEEGDLLHIMHYNQKLDFTCKLTQCRQEQARSEGGNASFVRPLHASLQQVRRIRRCILQTDRDYSKQI